VKLLLDTHSFLWFISGHTNLSTTACNLIEDTTNQPLLSIASLWEMAIKMSIGKLKLAEPFEQLVPHQMEINGIELLPVDVAHVAKVSELPFHHRDPFDRLLVAQAIIEQMPVVSADSAFDAYPIKRLW
jgi:PIN domain nuclease of toxin-antitoxin system